MNEHDAEVGYFRRETIPLVRQWNSTEVARRLVDVQPLLGPPGLIHYLRYRYADRKHKTQGRVNWKTEGF